MEDFEIGSVICVEFLKEGGTWICGTVMEKKKVNAYVTFVDGDAKFPINVPTANIMFCPHPKGQCPKNGFKR